MLVLFWKLLYKAIFLLDKKIYLLVVWQTVAVVEFITVLSNAHYNYFWSEVVVSVNSDILIWIMGKKLQKTITSSNECIVLHWIVLNCVS